MITVVDLGREVVRMDPSIDLRSDSYKAALCLLASVHVGPDPEKISGFTGVHPDLVGSFAERLTASGVWHKGRVYCEWFDKVNGGVAFWLDVCVAQGLIERAKRKRKVRSQKIGSVDIDRIHKKAKRTHAAGDRQS